MARADTAELRERVLLACERGGPSRASVAVLFGVGESTLCRWRQAWRTQGRREAKPHAGGASQRRVRLREKQARIRSAAHPDGAARRVHRTEHERRLAAQRYAAARV